MNQWEVKGGLVLVLHLFPEEDERNVFSPVKEHEETKPM